jgi:uncharacterized protein (DUF302 family)
VDYAYKRVVDRSFEETIEAVERSIEAHGFSVSGLHDVHHTLAAKGFTIRPLRIYQLVEKQQEAEDPRVELLLPARVHVFEDEGGVVVAALLPSIMCQVYPRARLDELASVLEGRVIDLVDHAVEP